MQEGSVQGAADRLYIGQSAVSMALRRLRDKFNDALFIRVGRQLEPTVRAESLYAELLPALQQIQQTLRTVPDIDPATFDFELRLGMTDDLELPLLPTILNTLRTSSPLVNLTVRRAPLNTVATMIESGQLDLAISWYPELPKWIHSQSLGLVPFLVLYDPEQLELSDQVTAQDYVRYEHILVSFSGTRKGVIDTQLEQLGLQRRISIALPSVASVVTLLKQQPMITTLPAYTAMYLAKMHGLSLAQPPVTPPDIELSMVWHRKRDSDPAHQWARTMIYDCYQQYQYGKSVDYL